MSSSGTTQSRTGSVRIVFLLSSSRAFPEALEWYRDEFPNCTIDVLVTEGSSYTEGTISVEGQVLELDTSRFAWEEVPLSTREQLQNTSYDRVVVLSNDVSHSSYRNVEQLARHIGGRVVEVFDFYNRRERLEGMNKLRLWGKRTVNDCMTVAGLVMTTALLVGVFFPQLIYRSLKYRTWLLMPWRRPDSHK